MGSMQRCVLLGCLMASAVLVSGTPAGAAPAGAVSAPAPVRGVVQSVQGGRVTVRLDDGRIQGFSVKPGTVTAGQRIQAMPVRSGDAMRLDQVQVLPASR